MQNKRFNSFLKPLLLSSLCILIALTGAGLYFWFVLDRPYSDGNSESIEFLVPKGTNFTQVAEDLQDSGIIDDTDYILWRYRIASNLRLAKPLLAGRYKLTAGAKASELIRILTSFDSSHRVFTKITIAPGLTTSRIAEEVQKSSLAWAEDVENAVRFLASEYPIHQTKEGLQGYLYPDTYQFEAPVEASEETSLMMAEKIVRLMADRFFSVLGEIEPTWHKLTPQQLHEKVILASIVEREYRVDEEAPMIASVFNNRIKEGMALQSCATVVYTIEETEVGKPFLDNYHRYNRRIFEVYLEIPSPYNTYNTSSLPPGPIANPGSVALNAAFYPAISDAMYFVVKNPQEGTHVFSRYYAEHLHARAEYLNQYIVKN